MAASNRQNQMTIIIWLENSQLQAAGAVTPAAGASGQAI
jgi:hypothetical protein